MFLTKYFISHRKSREKGQKRQQKKKKKTSWKLDERSKEKK